MRFEVERSNFMSSIILNSMCIIMIIISLIMHIVIQEVGVSQYVFLAIYALLKTIQCICYNLI